MNKTLALLLGLLMSVLPLTTHAAEQYKIISITPNLVQTPQYQVTGGEQHNQGTPGQWLEIEVKFATAVESDELTFKYYVLFNGVLLVGEVTHVSIPVGRELYSVMYVSPRNLVKLMGGTAKTPNATAVEIVAVQILNKGQLVAEKYSKAAQQNWFQTMQQVPGFLINKNETPFAPLYWDHYEAIKSK